MPNPVTCGARPADSLAALLEGVGVDHASSICVVGPHALPAVLWFCRHGYAQVGSLCRAGGPHEAPDAVIVAQPYDVEDLPKLESAAHQVRAGGVFVLQLRAGADPAEAERLLASAGFVVERRVAAGHRVIVVARRGSLRLAA